MGLVLLVILIGVPILEIALFIQVGGIIGVWPTIAICIATAVAGSFLVRLQGLQIVRQAQAKMARNEPPAAEMFHGMCLLLAGFLLMTPGFFTDVLGILLLLPPVRIAIGALLWRQFEGRIRMHQAGGGPTGGGPTGGGPSGRGPKGRGPKGGVVIDGDFEEVDGRNTAGGRKASADRPELPPADGKPNPSSPWRGDRS